MVPFNYSHVGVYYRHLGPIIGTPSALLAKY